MRPLPSPDPGAPVSIAHGIIGLMTNPTLIAALLSCAIAQLAKPVVHYIHQQDKQQLDWMLALSPGGMPSSHTAFVVGLTTALGLQEGTRSGLFALALVLTLVVAYAATGVRLHAGRHASVLNIIVAQLPPEHPAAGHMVLQETLGHTPAQVVAGAVVGLVVAYLCTMLWSALLSSHAVITGS
eukprot:GHRR01015342.1.p1 GENE.GHRR01015342.1~~GHRR01015342.1.p1  ORF type:complete len:183 (+),score=40.99 GHRR01015342.1:152-700(+)